MSRVSATATLELLKPITWFAPMWAYLCGIVSAGAFAGDRLWLVVMGVVLAGPMVCGTSQAVNDWFDRHVDKINQPDRPIPSGRLPGRAGLFIAVIWTGLSLLVATTLGLWGFIAAVIGLVLAWAYSAPPLRLKRNGWWGNAAVAICYEGLPWFTGAAIMAAALPDWRILMLAALYSVGAHGIMTLNDFKSIEGDQQMGVDSLPVLLGASRAVDLACWVMAIPQLVVLYSLLVWGAQGHAYLLAVLVAAQIGLMLYLRRRPRQRAPFYNATGTTLYVLGMLICADAVAGLQIAIAQ